MESKIVRSRHLASSILLLGLLGGCGSRAPEVTGVVLNVKFEGVAASQFEISVGDAANGLCGGMAFVTADHHNAGAPIWADSEPPTEGSDHFKALVRRQLDSFDFGLLPARFYLMQAFRNDEANSWSSILHVDGRAARTARDEWPTVQARLDAGLPGGAVALARAQRAKTPLSVVISAPLLSAAFGARSPTSRPSRRAQTMPGRAGSCSGVLGTASVGAPRPRHPPLRTDT